MFALQTPMIPRGSASGSFIQEYLKRFLNQGTLTKKDLLDFYSGEEIKDKYRLIEKEINEI